jgi:hypothetical protein
MPRKTKTKPVEFLPALPKKVSADVEKTLRQNTIYGTERLKAPVSSKPRTPPPKTPKTASADVLPSLKNATYMSRPSSTVPKSKTKTPTNVYNQDWFLKQRQNARDVIIPQAISQRNKERAEKAVALQKQNPIAIEQKPRKEMSRTTYNTPMLNVSNPHIGEAMQQAVGSFVSYFSGQN